MFDLFLTYLNRSSSITVLVLAWLSFYFILTFTILLARWVYLSAWKAKEQKVLNGLIDDVNLSEINSAFSSYINGGVSRARIDVCLSNCEQRATGGLTWLSIIASTAPFIGLFGTVVGILQTFSVMGDGNNSLSVIAPAISEALVATGVGIFVAIPAYTFNLVLKRKAQELLSLLKRESIVLLASYRSE